MSGWFQSQVMPAKAEPFAGLAKSVILLPAAGSVLHVPAFPVQLIPLPEVTVPLPVPASVTESEKAKVAVTVRGLIIVSVQVVPLRLSQPVQPETLARYGFRTDPGSGGLVRDLGPDALEVRP